MSVIYVGHADFSSARGWFGVYEIQLYVSSTLPCHPRSCYKASTGQRVTQVSCGLRVGTFRRESASDLDH